MQMINANIEPVVVWKLAVFEHELFSSFHIAEAIGCQPEDILAVQIDWGHDRQGLYDHYLAHLENASYEVWLKSDGVHDVTKIWTGIKNPEVVLIWAGIKDA